MLYLKDIKREIKRQHRQIVQKKRYYNGYNFLGLVENQDLSPEVMRLFAVTTPTGYTFYDWVHGNNNMEQLIAETANVG